MKNVINSRKNKRLTLAIVIIILLLGIVQNFRYKAIALKNAEEQLQIVIDSVEKIETLGTYIEAKATTANDENFVQLKESAFSTQISVRSANNTVSSVNDVAEHAGELAVQANFEANSAPESQAKQEALAQAQIATVCADEANSQAQNAMELAAEAEKQSNNGIKKVIKLEQLSTGLRKEADYVTEIVKESQLIQQDAEKRVKIAKRAIFATTAQAQAKFILEDALDAKESFNLLQDEIGKVIIISNYRESVTQNTTSILADVAELISKVNDAVDITSESDYNVEIALNNTLEKAKLAKTQASAQAKIASGSGVLTKAKGVNYFNGKRETWYSERVLPGGGLHIPGRHTDEQGLVRDGDGYICVASVDYPKGTILQTSLGMAKVYDCGCAPGTVDIYTNW